jgi:hypothetical protein
MQGYSNDFELPASSVDPISVFHRDHTAFAALLSSVHSFSQIGSKLILGCDPGAVSATFEQALAVPCVADQLHFLGGEEVLLVALKRWALAALKDDKLSQIRPSVVGESGTEIREYSASQCRGILANALLNNVVDTMAPYKENKGGLSLWRMMRKDHISTHKLASLLLYFGTGVQLEGSTDDDRVVRFEHIRCEPTDQLAKRLGACDMTLVESSHDFQLQSGGMEEAEDATAFVNFANKNFGYGKFIPSCTQEEILQVQYSIGYRITPYGIHTPYY